MLKKFYPYTIALFLLFSACSSDDDFGPKGNDEDDQTDIPAENPVVFILNEGNFQHGNASLDVYDPAEQNLNSGVFREANGQNLGDVAQSGIRLGDTLAIVVNNSAKIVLINADDYSLIDEIADLHSPRYMTVLPNGNWLVSELYNDHLYEIDPETGTIVKEHPIEGWTEELRYAGSDRVLVRNIDDKSLDVYNIGSSSREKQIDKGSVGGVTFTDDAAYYVTNKAVHRVTLGSDEPEQLVTFDDTLSARRAAVDVQRNYFYFLSSGIYRADLNSGEYEKIAEADGRNLYGLAVEPFSGDVYVTDSKDYVSRGTLYRYDYSGALIDEQRTGIIPQGIVF